MLIDNLAKLSRTSRSTVSAALIVIAAIAMYNWTVAPQAKYMLAAQDYQSLVGNVVEKHMVISEKVGAKRENLRKLQEQFKRLRGTLFTPEQAKQFFSDLQTISEESGCAVHSLNIVTTGQSGEKEQSQDASDIVPKSATLSVVGVYENIMKLMEKLQVRTQEVWIDSLRIELFDYESAQPRCDITVTVYTVEDEEAAI